MGGGGGWSGVAEVGGPLLCPLPRLPSAVMLSSSLSSESAISQLYYSICLN